MVISLSRWYLYQFVDRQINVNLDAERIIKKFSLSLIKLRFLSHICIIRVD
jgi:hypothetical protein